MHSAGYTREEIRPVLRNLQWVCNSSFLFFCLRFIVSIAQAWAEGVLQTQIPPNKLPYQAFSLPESSALPFFPPLTVLQLQLVYTI